MKPIIYKLGLLVAMLIAAHMNVSAQDIITKTDDSSVIANVMAISNTTVTFKKYDNPDGPTYTLPVSEIKAITFQNGTVERFNSSQQNETQTVVTSANTISDTQNVNDYRLLAIAGGYDLEKYEKRARTLRWVGGIGGGVLAIAGVALLYIDYQCLADVPSGSVIGGCLLGVGVAGGVGCFIAAHNQANKAKQIKSLMLSETTIFRSGQSQLSAGVDMLRYRNDPPALGVGLRLSF